MLHVLGAFGTIHPRHLEFACAKLKWEDIPSPLDRFPKGTHFDLRGVIPNHRLLRRQKDLSICAVIARRCSQRHRGLPLFSPGLLVEGYSRSEPFSSEYRL